MTNAKGMEWLLRSQKTMIMLVDVYKMRKHTSGKLVSRALMRFCVYSRVRDNVAICDAVYRRPSLSTRDEWSNCEKKKQYWTGEWYVATNIAMPDRNKVIIPRCIDAGPRQANRQFPYLNAWAEKLPQNWRTNWSEFNKCTAFIQQCRARSVSLGRGNIDSNQKIPRRILFYVNNFCFSSGGVVQWTMDHCQWYYWRKYFTLGAFCSVAVDECLRCGRRLLRIFSIGSFQFASSFVSAVFLLIFLLDVEMESDLGLQAQRLDKARDLLFQIRGHSRQWNDWISVDERPAKFIIPAKFVK